jgi:sensor histidine kinase regulating citrate/malate metabolism
MAALNQDNQSAISESQPHAKIAEEVLTALKNSVVNLLEASAKVESKDKVSLVLPARLLLVFGLLVIGSSIACRFLLGPFGSFPFQDFLTLLIVGCVLIAMGALLYIYQLATEQATMRALSQLAQNTAKDLAGQTDSQPESGSTTGKISGPPH